MLLLEVDTLAVEAQAKLAEALSDPHAGDVRLISTSRGELAVSVNAGAFREDLYDTLAAARLRLPALRDRREDLPALTYRILQNIPADVEAARTIAADALDELKRRDWPSNFDELRAVVERAAMISAGATVTRDDLAFEATLAGMTDATRTEPTSELGLFKEAKRSAVDEFERAYFARLVEKAGGSVTRAAALAGLQRHHVRELLRKHGLRSKDEPR